MSTCFHACFSLLLYIYDFCFTIKWSNLSCLICRHGFIFIPPVIRASLFDASAKMAYGNRNEALFEANEAGLWLHLKSFFNRKFVQHQP